MTHVYFERNTLHWLAIGLACVISSVFTYFIVDNRLIYFYTLSALSLALFLSIIRSWKSSIEFSYFNLFPIFFLMLWLFNCGKIFLGVFFPQYHEDYMLYFSLVTSYDLIDKALLYSVIGCFFINFGYILASNNRRILNKTENSISDPCFRHVAGIIGLSLLAISILPNLITLAGSLKTVFSGGYFALYEEDKKVGAEGSLAILSYFVYPSIYLLVFSDNKKTRQNAYFAIMFFLLVSNLALGGRLSAVAPFIGYIVARDKYYKDVPKKKIILTSLFLLFFLFPMIAALRNNFSVDGMMEFFSAGLYSSGSPIYKILKEMSYSINPLVLTLEDKDLYYGYSYLISLTTLIPNLFWDIHPARAESLSIMLVNTVNPWTAERGGGYGYSFFAELYKNFSYLGLPLCIIFGMVLGCLESACKYRQVLLSILIIPGMLLWPRGESILAMRTILWYGLIPYFMVLLVGWYFKAKKGSKY